MAKNRKIKVYPCVVYELTEQNIGYDKGYRYRVEDVDGDRWFFADKPRMFDVLSVHALHPLTETKMEEVRAERAKRQQK